MSVEENKELIRLNWRNWERVGGDVADIRSLYRNGIDSFNLEVRDLSGGGAET
jgi:hypothetical protein